MLIATLPIKGFSNIGLVSNANFWLLSALLRGNFQKINDERTEQMNADLHILRSRCMNPFGAS